MEPRWGSEELQFSSNSTCFLFLSAFPVDVVKWRWETKNVALQTLWGHETGDCSPEELKIGVTR